MSADSSKTVSDTITFSLVGGLAVTSTSALSLSIAIRFGAGYQADAFFLAYSVPGVLAGAMATAMRLVLVPSFVRLTEEHCLVTAWRIISTISIVGLVLWLIAASAGVIGGPLYMKAFAPSITLAARQLAVQISRWVFAIIPLTWLSELLRALLNSQRRFLLPLAGECFANVLAISLIVGWGKRTGIIIVGPGLVVKMLTQIAVSALGLGLATKDVWPIMTVNYGHEIWSVLRGLAVRWAGALLRQSSIAVERFWAAHFGVGSVSAVSYAQMGVNNLSSIFSTSVATVLLPVLSQATWRRHEGHHSTTTDALRLALFLTAPVAAFSVAFSYPACQIIFAFSDTSSTLVNLASRLFAIYALRIPTIALISVLLAPFYALEDVWTPVKHMALMLGVNLALDVLLFSIMNVYGFPTAAILTDMLSIARALWLQQRIGVRHSIRNLGRDLTIILMSTGVAVLIALATHFCGIHIIKADKVGQFITLGLAVIWGGAVYLVATRAAGIPEARLVMTMVSQRIGVWRSRC